MSVIPTETILVALTTFFATIGPADLALVFAALTHKNTAAERRAMALRGVLVAGAILMFFAVFGEPLLRLFGITLPALRVAGGILLLLISIDMVFARHSGGVGTTPEEEQEAATREDISVFPLAMPLIAGPGVIWNQVDAVNPDDQGQGGMQLRWSPEGSDFEYGLYFARYHAKTPSSFYFDPVGQTIRTVYGQDIRTYGVSATTSIGQLNLAAEASVRHNAPLNSDPQLVFYALGDTGDNDRNVRYAVGRTAHANLSGIYVLQPAALWDGGAFLFELAWNRVLSVSKNPAALDPNTTRDAWAMRMIFSPAYFQVLPGLDIEVPIGLGYNLGGRSGAIANFNGGASHGGDFSLGVNGTYQQVWMMGVSYVHFLGDEFSFVTPQNSPAPMLSFKQTRKDRNFISFNIQRTF